MLICILCGLMAGCKKQNISEDAAKQLVLEELGDLAKEAQNLHAHHDDANHCFNVFVTVKGLSMKYIVSDTGKILDITHDVSHSH